jgi:DNA-binding protein HU-beta
MIKLELVKKISESTGKDAADVSVIVESFMNTVKQSLKENDPVYLRGFGGFVNKLRAEKLGRNITKKTNVIIPSHYVPIFKPSDEFKIAVKHRVQVISI